MVKIFILAKLLDNLSIYQNFNILIFESFKFLIEYN
jgi:hypothetical protein